MSGDWTLDQVENMADRISSALPKNRARLLKEFDNKLNTLGRNELRGILRLKHNINHSSLEG